MTGRGTTSDALLGEWQLLRCEVPLEIQPGTRMSFRSDGALDYAIPTADGVLRVTLRWRLEQGTLHTVHDDGSNALAVAATIGEAEILSFDFGGPRAFFVRTT